MTTRGGKREGSGRRRGARNKRTVEFLKKAAALDYEDPVEFMLSVVADTKADMELRVRCAMGAAPYVRAKLAPVEKLPDKGQTEAPQGIAMMLPDLVRVG